MENQRLPVCPQCGKPAQLPDAAFCPYCGATMQTVPKPAVPEGAKSVLQKAAETADPRKKHKRFMIADNGLDSSLQRVEKAASRGKPILKMSAGNSLPISGHFLKQVTLMKPRKKCWPILTGKPLLILRSLDVCWSLY